MRLCRIDPDTGNAVVEFAAEGRDVDAWSLSPDGTQLATVENDRGWARLRIGPSGTNRPVVDGLPEMISDLAWAPDSSTLAFTAQGPASPPGIWSWEAASGQANPLWQPDPLTEAGIRSE